MNPSEDEGTLSCDSGILAGCHDEIEGGNGTWTGEFLEKDRWKP